MSTRTITAATVTFDIPEQLLLDVITTACEGGIVYWATARNVVRSEKLDWVSMEVADIEEEEADRIWHKLDATVVLLGMQRIVDGSIKVAYPTLMAIQQAIAEGDASHIDADAADVIVQAGLFNEIVYG